MTCTCISRNNIREKLKVKLFVNCVTAKIALLQPSHGQSQSVLFFISITERTSGAVVTRPTPIAAKGSGFEPRQGQGCSSSYETPEILGAGALTSFG
jgi:hypothetical protein